jgi:hypothetical protein
VKSRMRTLWIGLAEFRWAGEISHYDSGTDCHRCVRLRVWGGGKNGRVLRADLLSTTEPGPWGRCVTDDAYPTPGVVRKVVEYALDHGWTPTTIGGRFPLTDASDLELPGFVVTDKLRVMQHLRG